MKTRQLGDLTVSEVGMGCMAFSHGYGKIPPERYSIEAIQNAYRHGCTLFDTAGDSIAIPCTACRYCTSSCPKKIAIPEYFSLYNNQKQFGLLAGLATTYGNLTATHGKPGDCIGCKQCENHCPQHLPIVENLKLVAEAFQL